MNNNNNNNEIKAKPLIEFVKNQPGSSSWISLFGGKKSNKAISEGSGYTLYSNAAYIKSSNTRRRSQKVDSFEPYPRPKPVAKGPRVKKQRLTFHSPEEKQEHLVGLILRQGSKDCGDDQKKKKKKEKKEQGMYLLPNRTLLGDVMKKSKEKRRDGRKAMIRKIEGANTELVNMNSVNKCVRLMLKKRNSLFPNHRDLSFIPFYKDEEDCNENKKRTVKRSVSVSGMVFKKNLEKRRTSMGVAKSTNNLKLGVKDQDFKVIGGFENSTSFSKVRKRKGMKEEEELNDVVIKKKSIEGNDVTIKDFKINEGNRLDTLEKVSENHLKLVISNLFKEEGLKTKTKEWEDIILTICLNAVNMINIDTKNGDEMDIRSFIKIKKIPGGKDPKETSVFKGVVFANSLVNKNMRTSFKEPKILLLKTAIEFKEGNSLEDYLKHEKPYIEEVVKRIMRKKPNLILLEKHCCSVAHKLFVENGTSVMVNVKRKNLERIRRCNGIPLVNDVEELTETPMTYCEKSFLKSFEVDEKTEKKTKTFFFLKSSYPSRGFTVLLRGGSLDELIIVKKVMSFALYCAMHLRYENEFLHELGGTYLKTNSTLDCILSTSPMISFTKNIKDERAKSLKGKDIHNHQNIVVLLSREYKKKIDHSEYKKSEIVIVAYYTGNDMSFGKYLTEKCFNCEEQLNDAKRVFLHYDGKLVIDYKKVDERELFFEKIHQWSYCKKCQKYVTPVRKLSKSIWNFSFGKFLENTFYNKKIKCGGISGCNHSINRDHIRYYGWKNEIISFEWKKLEVFSVLIPGVKLTYNFDNIPFYLEKLRKELEEEVDKFLIEVDSLFDPDLILGEEKRKIFRKEWTERIRNIKDLDDYDRVVMSIYKEIEGEFKDLIDDSSEFFSNIIKDGQLVFGKMFKIFAKDPMKSKVSADKKKTEEQIQEEKKLKEKKIRVKLHVIDGGKRIGCKMEEIIPEEMEKEQANIIQSPVKKTNVTVPKLLEVISFEENPITIYKNEPTSFIAFALKSKEREKFKFCLKSNKLEDNREELKKNILINSAQVENFHFIIEKNLEDYKKRGFHCTSYYEKQFHSLRKIYYDFTDEDENLLITSLRHCREWIPSGGKSRATFVKTWDDRFVLKKFSKLELFSFLETAKDYFSYVFNSIFNKLPTSLAKIFGIYKLRYYVKGRFIKEDFVLMENLFYSKKIEKTYDLKGSLRNRFQSDIQKTLWDENLLLETYSGKNVLVTTENDKAILTTSVHNDSLFLSKLNIMDYSLLVGIDFSKKEISVGIIDAFRQYTLDKQFETYIKSVGSFLATENTPTVISPKYYKNRLREAIEKYFQLSPNKFTGFVDE